VCSGVFRNLPLSGERLVGVCLGEEIVVLSKAHLSGRVQEAESK
jgi:hypothetical protein